ncbi:hypothetical protein [Spirosoma sp. KNUC1025]|uniref:hypothetical protein n=1 Tax=Spirosoma sp. KNUC1025 TaxID=2894082 RepID=UPI00386E4FF6|nr:hypothetical protein LN737_19400 [Spirosoma sp. KNUC1025]
MGLTHGPSLSILEPIHDPGWTINQWKIAFQFSERLLARIKKRSRLPDWYEDPVVAAVYVNRLSHCFASMQIYHATFGNLPQVGDRLIDEQEGLFIQERFIDGLQMTITLTLSN